MTVTISVTARHQIGDGLACFGVGTVTISVTSLLTIRQRLCASILQATRLRRHITRAIGGHALQRPSHPLGKRLVAIGPNARKPVQTGDRCCPFSFSLAGYSE